MHYKSGSMPKDKQCAGPQSAPKHLMAPGTKPPQKISGGNPHDPAKAGWSKSYRQGGRKGGNEASS